MEHNKQLHKTTKEKLNSSKTNFCSPCQTALITKTDVPTPGNGGDRSDTNRLLPTIHHTATLSCHRRRPTISVTTSPPSIFTGSGPVIHLHSNLQHPSFLPCFCSFARSDKFSGLPSDGETKEKLFIFHGKVRDKRESVKL